MSNNIEYLDVVDDNNQIITQAPKDAVHNQNLLHRSSHILISYKNTIFLQLRSKLKQQFPNKWDTSVAGHLIAGEDYYQCAVRETQEELGFTVSKLQEIADIPASEHTGFEFIKLYLVDCSSSPTLPKFILEPSEITTGGWFAINDVDQWVKTDPNDFAGCFDLIWASFQSYFSAHKIAF